MSVDFVEFRAGSPSNTPSGGTLFVDVEVAV